MLNFAEPPLPATVYGDILLDESLIQTLVSVLALGLLDFLLGNGKGGILLHQFHQSLVFSGVGDAGLLQGGLGGNNSVVGEIDSKQVLHNISFLMLLASCVFFRSPPLFFLL